jgi:hypothetical protein
VGPKPPAVLYHVASDKFIEHGINRVGTRLPRRSLLFITFLERITIFGQPSANLLSLGACLVSRDAAIHPNGNRFCLLLVVQ